MLQVLLPSVLVLCSVDGGVDAGVTPSSVWLSGPNAVRQPLPSDPPVGPDRRFLDAVREDGGIPAQRPFHPYAEGLGFQLGADAGPAYVTLKPPTNDDGSTFLGLPPLVLAIPMGPEQAEVTAPVATTQEATGLVTPVTQLGRMTDSVGRQEAAQQGIGLTSELLARLPGVWLQRSIHGAGSPMVRGMGGSRVAITVDGIRLNTTAWGDTFSPLLATVDATMVDSAQVVTGGSSVTHGSDALGGVLALTMRSPQHQGDLTVHTDGAAYYQSADQGRQLRLYGEGGIGPLTASLGGSVRELQDLRAGRNQTGQWSTALRDIHIAARARTRVYGQEFFVGFDAARVGQMAYTALCQPPPARRGVDCSVYDELYRDLAYAGLRLKPRVLLEEVEVRAYYQHQWNTLSRTNFNTLLLDRMQDDVHVFGGFARARSPLYSLGFLAVRMMAGMDGAHEVTDSRFHRAQLNAALAEVSGLGNQDRRRARLANGTYTSMSAHALMEWWLFRMFFLRVGARSNVHRALARASDRDAVTLDRLFLVPSGMAQLGAALGDRGSVALSLLHGYHAPNLWDLTGRGLTDVGFEYAQPNAAKVEHAYTLDLSTRLHAGRLTVANSVFATRWNDAPTRVRSSYDGEARVDDLNVYERRPGDDLWMLGGELWADVRLISHLHLGGAFNYVLAERVRNKDPLPGHPPPNGTVRVLYLPPVGFYGVAMCRFAMPARRLSALDRELPALYDPAGTQQSFVFSVGGGYQLTTRTAVDLFVDNVTDDVYRLHGAAVLGSGVSARIQLRLGF